MAELCSKSIRTDLDIMINDSLSRYDLFVRSPKKYNDCYEFVYNVITGAGLKTPNALFYYEMAVDIKRFVYYIEIYYEISKTKCDKHSTWNDCWVNYCSNVYYIKITNYAKSTSTNLSNCWDILFWISESVSFTVQLKDIVLERNMVLPDNIRLQILL
jgi:hypothetical protein